MMSRRHIVITSAAPLAVLLLTAEGCLHAPAPPPSWNFAIQAFEKFQGLPAVERYAVGIYGHWIEDFPFAYGTQFVLPKFRSDGVTPNQTTDSNGVYYCQNCRVRATWTFQESTGACADLPPQPPTIDMFPGDIKPITCVIQSFGHFDGFGYLVDYIPNEYWSWQDDSASPPAPGSAGTLTANQALFPGQSLNSPNGAYSLAYQGDGNLVLYSGSGPIWASNTAGTSPGQAVMQGDGNFVVYDGSGTPVWATNTVGKAGAYLAVYDGGSFLIFDSGQSAAWWSGTNGF